VPEHTRKYLMGHEISDITHANYFRAGDPIAVLKECVDRIDIDCSRIRLPFPDVRPAEGPPVLRVVATEPERRSQAG
jgi:hypothetical protein